METKKDFLGALGRRKTSVARIRFKNGNGQILVNKKDYKVYFPRLKDQLAILKPLDLTQMQTKYDIFVNVKGGGTTGQSGAIQHGISHALLRVDEEYRKLLKQHHLLTRDSRMVERKKYGRKGARKRFQFSKR